MASRSAGTLLTEFNAAYVPPSLMPGYQGHVPSAAFSFGSTYGSTTLKYFQDQRHTTMEKSHTPYSKGSHFPTLFSPDPNLVLSNRSHLWDHWLHAPSYTRFNLDSDRAAALARFYQASSDPEEQVAPFKSVPENLKTYQTFPSGKRVAPQERRQRDCYFEFRA